MEEVVGFVSWRRHPDALIFGRFEIKMEGFFWGGKRLLEENKRCHGWEYKNTLTSPALGKFGRKKQLKEIRFIFVFSS